MASNTVTEVMDVLAPLSMEDKLKFLSAFANVLVKEVRKGQKLSARKSKVGDETKPKRKTAAATYAWLTYEKEVMRMHPELFVGIIHVAARRKIVSDFKKEHEDHYAAYVKKYTEDLEAGLIQPPMSEKLKKKLGVSAAPVCAIIPDASEAEEEEEQKVVAPPPVSSKGKAKVEEMNKKIAEKKAAEASVTISDSTSNVASAQFTEKPKTKRISIAKKAKASAKEEEAKPGEGEEFITVESKNYIRLLENNGCFVRNDNGTFGPWVGIYDEKTKTIRKTASPSDV